MDTAALGGIEKRQNDEDEMMIQPIEPQSNRNDELYRLELAWW
jgi:hypothetical protein